MNNSTFAPTKIMRLLGLSLCLSAGLGLQTTAQNDISSFTHDNTRVTELTFSSNGRMLIAKSGDEVITNSKGIATSPSIHIWELETRRKALAIADKEYGRAACVSSDGALLAYREKNAITVMDLNSKKLVSSVRLSDTKSARPIAFINDRKGLVLSIGDQSAVYDISKEVAVFERDYTAKGLYHNITPDDTYAIERYVDSFKVLDFKTGRELHTFAFSPVSTIANLVLSPENRFIAALNNEGRVMVWDMISAKMVHTFNIAPKDMIYTFTTDGRYLIGGSDTLKLWELKTKREIAAPISTETKITSVAVSPDGRYLACGDQKGNIKLWNCNDETIALLYFKKEIGGETALIGDKPKEFERTYDFLKRREKLKRSINNKYLTQYLDKITSEQTVQEQWIAEDELRAAENINTIRNSRTTISFRIDSISTYNADKETFTVRIVNEQERYARIETIKVPLKDNPQCFKAKYQSILVEGLRQLTEDLKSYEIFNVKIKTNCSGKEREYLVGEQRTYLTN